MGHFIREYVSTCDVCGRVKNRPTLPLPLQPNAIPTRPWQIITADFIVGLPKSHGFDSIWVCCDRFTKMSHLVPCHETITAAETAELFQKYIFCHYGLPEQLITDRVPQFTAGIFRSLCKTLGILPSLSTAYHPQTDGHSERTNQELEQVLRAFINF